MWFTTPDKIQMPSQETALAGRDVEMQISGRHFVSGNSLKLPAPKGMRNAIFGLGCFWGAERLFWQMDGVFSTAVGYSGGYTKNPTYEEVCSGRTGHNEVVLVIYDPSVISYSELLRTFFEGHDPTQGMRQGNDVGTQYRSGIYVFDEGQRAEAIELRNSYECVLQGRRYPRITTEITDAKDFYYAEEYHQQYLAKNPGGYCGLGGTGVACPKPTNGPG
jgi:peptide-methionine (S)-S-oxide reductase